ncbi:dihydrofolate reductase family protein [Xenorhabdus bovienii]|uniref:dihydrofolate reductase family protein n=1 Tax=Xenorhabdus bovienii TaxID=40576 RepID=UPI001EE0C239|nr:dihydrofolate reductase family protein [Xenorhabdus bovienii]MCG3472304.1 dihydrofolate reductase family protein [Xenorhabdus bovienii]
MSKLIYYVAATMDGYIATQQHKLDWLESFTLGDDATPYDDFYQTIGAVIMGAETYNWIMINASDDWPYQNVPAFIVTSRDLPVPAGLDITLVQGDASIIAAQTKRAAKGQNVWLVGGGKTAAYFAEAGELQQLFITTIPVFLGTGVEVLPVSHNMNVTPKVQRILQSGAMECVSDVKLA